MVLEIYTFRSFEVHRDGLPIAANTWKTQKNKHLCKILLTYEGQALPKERLIDWLWSDLEPDAAARNLRVAVSQLRKVLEPDLPKGSKSSYVLTTDAGYVWNMQRDDWLDVAEFEQLCQRFDPDDALHDHQLEYAEHARKLYRGPYLEEDRYEDWAIARREQLQLIHFDLLTKLSEAQARLGRYQQALAHCREILRADPCRESVWAQLMLYLYCAGNQPDALRAYNQCVQVLAADLGVEPNAHLKELHKQIRNRHLPDVDDRYPMLTESVPDIPYALSPNSVPFVGRQMERTRVKDLLEQAHQGHGGCILVGGEAGVGKTRLVQETLTDAAGFASLSAYVHTLEQNMAYQAWGHVLNQAIEQVDASVLKSVQPVWLAEVVNIVPSLHVRFELSKNPDLNPEQQQHRFYEAVFQVLSTIVQQVPMIILIDDIHWLDEASFDLWQFLLPRLKTLPLCIIGTYRQDDESDALSQFLKQGAEHLETINLPRLNSQEGLKLLRNLPLRLEDVDTFCGNLYKNTEGNPLFMISTLQHLFESGAFSAEEQGWVAADEAAVSALTMSPTVQALILKRLERLDDPSLKLLRLISVIGREVDVPLLELAWEQDVDCVSTLMMLTSAQLLNEHMGQYTLSHGKIGEVVYEQMADPMRHLLHQRALYALEQRYLGQLDAWLGMLLQHAFRAGVWEKALTYAVQALSREDRIQLQEKLTLAELGVEAAQRLAASGKDTHFAKEQLFELLLKRTEIFALKGNRDDQGKDLMQLTDLANTLDDAAKHALVLTKQMLFQLAKGEFDDAIESANKAFTLYETEQDLAGQGNCFNHIGQVLHRQGNPEAGLDAMQQALVLFEQCKNLRGQADCLQNIGQIYFFSLAKYEQALDFFKQANTHYATIADPIGQASCCNSIGNVCMWCLNRPQEAIDRYQQALDIAHDVGDRFGQGLLLNNIGNVYRRLHLGKHHIALDYLQQAHDIGKEVADSIGQSISLSNIGKVYFSIGGYDKAIEYHQRALNISRDIGERDEEAGNLYELGKTYLMLGDAETALQCLQQSLSISKETEDARALIYCNAELGKAYSALRQLDVATAHYEQAQKVLNELDIPEEQLNLHIQRTMTYLELGQPEDALCETEQAVELIESNHDEGKLQEVYFLHHQVLSALGHEADAVPYLQQAYDTMMKIADKMQSQDDRDSYLTNVQHNANLIAAWKQYSQA